MSSPNYVYILSTSGRMAQYFNTKYASVAAARSAIEEGLTVSVTRIPLADSSPLRDLTSGVVFTGGPVEE